MRVKIALVNKSVSLSHGGLERFAANLARSLREDGHQVHVFAEKAEDLPEGVAVHPIRTVRKPSFRRLVSFATEVRRQISRERFDVVYGLTHMLDPDLYRMGDGVQRHWMRTRYPFSPWRWVNYLVNPAHAIHLYLERRIYRGPSFIVTNSDLCRRQVHCYYGVAADRVRVVYNGVDHRLFNPEAARSRRDRVRSEIGIRDDEVLLLHVSNNWQRKGLKVTLEAVAQVGKAGSKLHLLVVGRGRAEAFHRLADRLGLQGKVHFRAPTTRIADFYGAADLLVLPTLYDPFSNVCLEAMACGLPVITTRANGAAELIEAGCNGFVQENARSAEELAALLRSALEPGKLQPMGSAARETSLAFTLERNLQETLEVFRQVTSEVQDGRNGG